MYNDQYERTLLLKMYSGKTLDRSKQSVVKNCVAFLMLNTEKIQVRYVAFFLSSLQNPMVIIKK